MFLGIEAHESGIRTAAIKSKKDLQEVELKSYSDEDHNVKLLYIKNLNVKRVVSGINIADSFIKKITLKADTAANLRKAIAFQIKTLHEAHKTDIAESVHYFSKNELLYLAAIKKLALKHHLNALKKFEIDPDVVSLEASALGNFAKHYLKRKEDVLVFYFKDQAISYVLSRAGLPFISGSLKIPPKSFDLLAREKKNLLEPVKQGKKKNPALENILEGLQGGLFQIIKTAKKSSSDFTIILTGRDDIFDYIKILIEKETSINVTLCDKKISRYAAAIGFAIEGALFSSHSFQFRKEEFITHKIFKKRKALMLGSSFILLLSALAVQFAGSSLIKRNCEALAISIAKTYKQDPVLKHKSLSYESNSIPLLLSEIEKEIDNSEKMAYLIKEPKISFLLNLLNHHPLLAGADISSIKYELIKFPKDSSDSSEFKAKIDMEFTAESSSSARKFHEALLSGNDLADNKEDIKWEVFSNTCQTSFYININKILKNYENAK